MNLKYSCVKSVTIPTIPTFPYNSIPYKLPVNMVDYKYTDQLVAMIPLYRNEQLCWNELLCRNKFASYEWLIQLWMLTVESWEL